MFRVVACITQEHDLRLVVLAAVICFFACLAAASLLSRAAAASGRLRFAWLLGTAVVTGSGVWATHFVAMLAFRPSLPVGYDFALTLLSVLIAIAVTGVGFATGVAAGRDRPGIVLLGGAIIGLGVFSMHFTGMSALRVPAAVAYDAGYVIASLLIGTVFGAAALRVALRAESLPQRLQGAGLLALAICGLHFTAMASVTLTPNPHIPIPHQAMSDDLLAFGVSITTLLILAIGLAGSIIDQRLATRAEREAARLRVTVAELEATQERLQATTADLTRALEAAAAGSQAKSQFLATMSHELRTPLNAIIGFAEVLENPVFGQLTDKQREYVADMRQAGAHLLGLVNDILDLSKMDANRLELDNEDIDVADAISGAAAMIAVRAVENEVLLTQEIAPDLPNLRADRRRLRQILLNLLSNAVKFTPAGGRVSVSAMRHGDGLAIVVADTGIGIAAEDIPRALERFGQVDGRLARTFEGTGLGLPLAKRLMELHGGALELESAVGVGTTVRMTFPAARVVHASKAA